ncbi:hypothetical protein N7504_001127 [Penicillium tannophilum]|nr:hypothetical protein N7504_011415 [Penicillium tannophilum]KAJ5917112.1 hypothetical protein N7504_001127 [Penicillium tannophilum]
MNSTVMSLLCDKFWYWDSNDESWIKFKENGTGSLFARREFCIFIAAEFDWIAQNPEILSSEVDTQNSLVCHCEIEISLTNRYSSELTPFQEKRLVEVGINKGNAVVNSFRLSDEAFTRRKFAIRIEQGEFITGEDKKLGLSTWAAPNFAYRLIFDSSPYPPQNMWKEDTWGDPLGKLRLWEWNEFYAKREPRSSWMWKIFGRLFR